MNNDDFEDDDDALDFDDTGFDEFDGSEGGNTLGDLWRNNPAFKIGVVVVGFIVVIIIITMLSGDKEQSVQSRLPNAPDVAARPGDQGDSPAYIEALVDENTERFEQAYSSGGSAIPTPINTPDPILSLADRAEEEEDPLQRWRRLQELQLRKERKAQEEETARNLALAGQGFNEVTGPSPEEIANRNNALQAMADSMAAQMQSILDNNSTVQVSSMYFTGPEYLEQLAFQEEAEAQAAAAETEQEAAGQKTLVPAGQIAYAQLITEANSDVPGPVLAEIMSGPLRGSRMLGSFQVQKELLSLQFNTVVIDEVSYGIDAIALDPGTTLAGMATDVDHHYLKRIVLPMAAAFIEGTADAIANTGRTDITIQGETVSTEEEAADNEQQIATGITEAGSELSEILDDMAGDLEVTVIVASGTPMGVLFTQAMTVPADSAAAQ